MPNTTVRAAAEGMPATKKMTFHDLESLILDADNMLEVLVNMLDQSGFNSSHKELTERDRDLIIFSVNVAVDMSQKVRTAYYEVFEGDASCC